jgi:hypothetical protein
MFREITGVWAVRFSPYGVVLLDRGKKTGVSCLMRHWDAETIAKGEFLAMGAKKKQQLSETVRFKESSDKRAGPGSGCIAGFHSPYQKP